MSSHKKSADIEGVDLNRDLPHDDFDLFHKNFTYLIEQCFPPKKSKTAEPLTKEREKELDKDLYTEIQAKIKDLEVKLRDCVEKLEQEIQEREGKIISAKETKAKKLLEKELQTQKLYHSVVKNKEAILNSSKFIFMEKLQLDHLIQNEGNQD